MTANNNFLDKDFLLFNDYSKSLYHQYAAPQPIIDYHCHLSPKLIAENHQFENITKIWIDGDHYKWRAMRTLGVNEKYITGDASDKEKFLKWAACVPKLIRNPLYHWTHLELQRYFNIDTLLNPETAEDIYEKTTAMLQQPDYSCLGLLKKMNVSVVCTTEDPIDTLTYHEQFKNHPSGLILSTAFRPDKAIEIQQDNFLGYLKQLEKVAQISINSYETLKEALSLRMDYFDAHGCKLSDHGLEYVPFASCSETQAAAILQKRFQGEELSTLEVHQFKTAITLFLAKSYHKRGWVQQFHLGAMRNNNKRMLSELGPDTGWDSIGNYNQAAGLSKFLDTLDGSDQLAKTILYNLNPADNEIFATMIGNFNDGSVKGKVQFGSGWWFLDQLDGMTKQINALSNMGVLSTFVGMLTDSRSFMSFPRHEYFRRLLCQLIGADIDQGLLPNDMKSIGQIVEDICFNNAQNFFNFK